MERLLKFYNGKHMKVSIIVPLYNAENYIKQCVESILCIKSFDWECLVVDDGSSDRSATIIDEIAMKESRIRVFHINNGGVSNARNVGIKNSTGDCCIFLDSDDYFIPEIDELLKQCKMSEIKDGLISFGFYYEFTNGKRVYNGYPQKQDITIERKIKEMVIKKQLFNSSCGRLYDLSLIKKYDLRFDKEIRIGEDAIFVSDYLKYIKQFVVIDRPCFVYRCNRDSAMHTTGLEAIDDELLVYKRKIELASKLNISLSDFDYREINSMYFNNFLRYMQNSLLSKLDKKLIVQKASDYFSRTDVIRIIALTDSHLLNSHARIAKKILLCKRYRLFMLVEFVVCLVKKIKKCLV